MDSSHGRSPASTPSNTSTTLRLTQGFHNSSSSSLDPGLGVELNDSKPAVKDTLSHNNNPTTSITPKNTELKDVIINDNPPVISRLPAGRKLSSYDSRRKSFCERTYDFFYHKVLFFNEMVPSKKLRTLQLLASLYAGYEGYNAAQAFTKTIDDWTHIEDSLFIDVLNDIVASSAAFVSAGLCQAGIANSLLYFNTLRSQMDALWEFIKNLYNNQDLLIEALSVFLQLFDNKNTINKALIDAITKRSPNQTSATTSSLLSKLPSSDSLDFFPSATCDPLLSASSTTPLLGDKRTLSLPIKLQPAIPANHSSTTTLKSNESKDTAEPLNQLKEELVKSEELMAQLKNMIDELKKGAGTSIDTHNKKSKSASCVTRCCSLS
jgi:hypothetical protein